MMEYKYFAFISYNWKDTKWGKRVQRKLENYRLPTAICRQQGWKRKPMKPVFFAPTDIQPGGLSEELKGRLKASKYLVVICSPNSAQSNWVGQEIVYFHELGRDGQLLLFIVDGVPYSGSAETECYHPVINALNIPEQLGANVYENVYRWKWLNKERAYIQLISKMLGLEFDTLWQRQRRRLIQRAVAWTAGLTAVMLSLLVVWQASQPVEVRLSLSEKPFRNTTLPNASDALVTVCLDNETKKLHISDPTNGAVLNNIPHRYLGRPVHLTVSCPDFLPVDTIVILTREMRVALARDLSVYGDVHFMLCRANNGDAVPDTRVSIGRYETHSDKHGKVSLLIPLQDQKTKYVVSADAPLLNDTLFMPCGKDDVLLVR